MMRRRVFFKMMGLGAATALLPRWALAASEAKPQPNVLFISTDDLNDWVGCLGGRSDINTPNIDRLAKRGVLFTNAHNTVIVFWPDHGYHFGEKHHMAKRLLWERATRVPLIVVAPGITKPGGQCARPVNLMALYPTLVGLCGLPPQKKIEGDNIAALLRDPDVQLDHVAITTHTKASHSIRDQRWRYIRYVNGDEELYDHETDPDEWNNLAA